jgi:hypothetical protein
MPKYKNLSLSKTRKRYPVIFLFLLIFSPFSAFSDTLTVHFLYGSKPAKGSKKTENKWFGGLHGGHVTVQIDDHLYGFGPVGRNHIFAHRKNYHAAFQKESHANWVKDTSELKYLSVKILVEKEEADSLLKIFNAWIGKAPYDYAFFGVRCASCAYNGLSKIGLLKKRSRFGFTYKYFYPKLLRKHLLKKAKSNQWEIVSHQGRMTRKWEKD